MCAWLMLMLQALLWSLVVFAAAFALLYFLSNRDHQNDNLSASFPWQFRFLAKARTPMLVLIVVPLSFIRWCWKAVRETVRAHVRGFESSKAGHGARVSIVLDAVRAWNRAGRRRPMRTARPNWAGMSIRVASNKQDSHLVQVDHLNHILELDTDAMTVTVEPRVTMGQIYHSLLPRGYALLVQVEMEDITVGGAAMGFGLETNSHLHGFLQETVIMYELVTADGQLKQVTAESDPELFYAMPWSTGSIGFLTALTLRIQKVKPYIHVTYVPTRSAEELQEKMSYLADAESHKDPEETPDFLEATIFTPTDSILQIGRWSDGPSDGRGGKVNGINNFWKPFYYRWVETFLSLRDGETFSEYLPVRHYNNRFARSVFWELEDMIPFSNHWLYRVLWGWLGAPEVSLLKLFQGPVVRKASVFAHVVQESIMPIHKIAEGMNNFDQWFGVYPLLVFPIRVYDRGQLSGMLHPRKDNLLPGRRYGLWVDMGAYGVPRVVKEGGVFDARNNCKAMERWTAENGGWLATYTDMFVTREEYRAMYDHTLLDKARRKYNAADAFPEPFEKVKPEPGLLDFMDELKENGNKKKKQ